MASLMTENNELIRTRGGQLHTIRMLIKSSEVTAQPRTKNWVGENSAPSSPSEIPHSFILQGATFHEAFPDSPHPPGPAHPRIQPMRTSQPLFQDRPQLRSWPHNIRAG